MEKIAVCYWRLRRVLRCEAGEIRKRLDTIGFDTAVARAKHVREQITSWSSQPLDGSLVHSSQGAQNLLGILKRVRGGLQDLEALSDEVEDELTKAFGDKNGTFGCVVSFYLWVLRDGPTKRPDEFAGYGELPDRKQCKSILEELLDEKEESLQNAFEVMKESEGLHDQAEIASLSLPSAGPAEKILRYETAIERQMHRAMNQLERFQQQRRGDYAPPPVSIDVIE